MAQVGWIGLDPKPTDLAATSQKPPEKNVIWAAWIFEW